MGKLTYEQAGVDIHAGENAVSRIKPLVKKTFNKNVLSHIGGFGGLYNIDLEKWKKPVLVSSADGVGTKLVIAVKAGIYDTVGQDLVNHCVDDIFVQGAHPQYFLDYIGVGKLHPQIIENIIAGFSKACQENGMALIGGEMAEMPGIYSEDDFDLAGTIVGMIERDNIITGQTISEGDVVIGYKSTGLHTNGYSLARKIIFDKLNMTVESVIPECGKTVAEVMLSIHKSYYPELKDWALPEFVHGMAHITGGGIVGNLKRVIPDGLRAEIDTKTWDTPAVFSFLQNAGNVEMPEMFSAFNMGIGFMVVADKNNADKIIAATDGIPVGEIVKGDSDEKVRLSF